MKPHWDKLMAKYQDHKDVLIADVDCTAGGEELCQEVGVEGYPTIKWGDPSDLQDYEGGRELKELKKFAKENLKPMCSPKNIDLCDEEKKKKINELMAMPVKELKAKIEEFVQKQTDTETNFKTEVEALQKRYEQLEKEKTETLKQIKESGLGLQKAVLASRKDKDEL